MCVGACGRVRVCVCVCVCLCQRSHTAATVTYADNGKDFQTNQQANAMHIRLRIILRYLSCE